MRKQKSRVVNRRELREQYERFDARVRAERQKRLIGWGLVTVLLLLAISLYVGR